MKKMIAALTIGLVVSGAHAAIVASMPNKTGGRIDLLDTPVPSSVQETDVTCKSAFIVKAWDTQSEDSYGCWRLVEDTVVITMPGVAGSFTYPASHFKVPDLPKKK